METIRLFYQIKFNSRDGWEKFEMQLSRVNYGTIFFLNTCIAKRNTSRKMGVFFLYKQVVFLRQVLTEAGLTILYFFTEHKLKSLH